MIKFDGLNFSYENKVIFKNASLEVPENKVSVILGPNGAGKSTLLKIITGDLKTNIKIENTFKNTFYLPQNPYYPKGITVFDYLSSVFFKNNWKWYLNNEEKNNIDKVLEQIELSEKKNINIEKLSGGELQKINIALGLLTKADLFLLDEPASNMDLINSIKILKMLKKLANESITSVIIMHDLNLSIKYGDNFIGVGYDNKITQSNKQEFATAENLKQLYGIDFEIITNGEKLYAQVLD